MQNDLKQQTWTSSNIRRVTVYLIHGQGKKMPYFCTTNKSTSHKQRKNVHMLYDNLGILVKAQFSGYPEAYCNPVNYSLPPPFQTWGPEITAKRKSEILRSSYLMCVFFDRKNPNRSVNIIIYLSLQWWWKNVQVSSFNKV